MRDQTSCRPRATRKEGTIPSSSSATFAKRQWVYLAPGLFAAALLAGCSSVPPKLAPGSSAAPVATRWHASLPHDGTLVDLGRWWDQFDDPLLLRLILEGQRVSPTLAQAAARIADARAASVSGRARLMPSLDAVGTSSRGRQVPGEPVATSTSVGLQASWELDVFGAGRAGSDAALARLESSEAGWHDARVSVASEIAVTYISLRACEAQLLQSELDARSRFETSRLTALAVKSGFQAPEAGYLAQASAAQSAALLTSQYARCDLIVKAMAALTAIDERELRSELSKKSGVLPAPANLSVDSVPAKVLSQRPDIVASEREVIAAHAEMEQAKAQRLPSISLTGIIGSSRATAGGVSTDGSTWTVGPVVVTLPLFDAGVRRANAEAAKARYEAARTTYLASIRAAVREVESALVALESATARDEKVAAAAAGFLNSFNAVDARYRLGAASLFELEDARRSMVAANSAQIEQKREVVAAWISVYRAIGGGWSPSATSGTPNS